MTRTRNPIRQEPSKRSTNVRTLNMIKGLNGKIRVLTTYHRGSETHHVTRSLSNFISKVSNSTVNLFNVTTTSPLCTTMQSTSNPTNLASVNNRDHHVKVNHISSLNGNLFPGGTFRLSFIRTANRSDRRKAIQRRKDTMFHHRKRVNPSVVTINVVNRFPPFYHATNGPSETPRG